MVAYVASACYIQYMTSNVTQQQIGTTIAVTSLVQMVIYYERSARSWYAYYTDNEGNQIGQAWFDCSRDNVLIQRPDIPAAV